MPGDYAGATLSCGWSAYCVGARFAPVDRSAPCILLESLAPSSGLPTIGRAEAIVPADRWLGGRACSPREAPMRRDRIRVAHDPPKATVGAWECPPGSSGAPARTAGRGLASTGAAGGPAHRAGRSRHVDVLRDGRVESDLGRRCHPLHDPV